MNNRKPAASPNHEIQFTNKHIALGILGLFSFVSVAQAAITTTGDTSPTPVDVFWAAGGDPVDSYTDIIIGETTASVGDAITGSLTVDGASALETGEAYIGEGAGTYGAVTVSGAGSTWAVNQDPALNTIPEDENFGEINSAGAIVVGGEGKGALTIQSSAQVTAHNLYIADSTTADGAVLVESGAMLTVVETIEVGFDNTASMIVQGSGTTVDTHSLIVGVESTAVGTLTVTDGAVLNGNQAQAGVTYSDPATFVVGEFGTGTMHVTDGGQVNSAAASIGENTGATGTVTVGGAGAASSWNVDGNLDIGKTGTGTLTLANGGTVDVDGVTELSADGGTGSLVFSGGVLNTGMLGADVSDLSGTGTINTSGLAGVLDKVTFAAGNTYSETLTSGGPTSVTVNVTADGNGDLYDVDFDAIGSGLDPKVVAFDNVGLGDTAGTSNTGLVTGPSMTFAVTNDLDVGFEGTGTLTVSADGDLTAKSLSIGTQSTGMGLVTVTGAGSTLSVTNAIIAGESGQGDLEILSGASVSAGSAHIGLNDNSSGEIIVDAATLNVTGNLSLGQSGNGYGGLEIANAGVVSVADTTAVVNGTIGFGAGNNGVLNTGNLVLGGIDDLEGTGTINTSGINYINNGITTATFDGDNANPQLYTQNLATSYLDEGTQQTVNGSVAVNLTGDGGGDLTDVNLVVRDGAVVAFDQVGLSRSGAGNTVLITGANSELDVLLATIGYSGDGYSPMTNIVAGDATVTVDQGGRLDAEWYVNVGTETGSSGQLLVRNGSNVQTSHLSAGSFGSATVEISGGSIIHAISGNSSVYFGAHAGTSGSADVTVDGAGSQLISNGYIKVDTTASLTVSNGAVVNQNGTADSFTVGDGASVTLTNGTINASSLKTTDAGAFSGTGTINTHGIMDLYSTINFNGSNSFSTTLAGGGIDLNVTANGDGNFSADNLNITNGAVVGAYSVIADQLLVGGAASQLNASRVTTFAGLDVNGAAGIDAGSLHISNGYGLVEGAGTSVALTGTLSLGASDSSAYLFIEDGASVTAQNVYINDVFESVTGLVEAAVEVIDAGSALAASESIYVGRYGRTADLLIDGGATVSAGNDIVIGTDGLVDLTVYGNSQLNAGTDTTGGIQNDGVVNLFAYAGLAAGVYTPVTVGSTTGEIAGSGSYNAFGGSFNVANGEFTVGALVDGSAGLINQDLSGLRANFDSGALVVSFADGADAAADFSVAEITDVASVGGFSTLQVYGFTTDMTLAVDEAVLLSFFVGEGLNAENFEFWHRDDGASPWTLLDPNVSSYVDGWVNFSVTGFSDYALTIPEPQTYALIFGALTFAGVVLRRRR